MASFDPNDPNDPFDPPRTPRMVLKDDDSGEQLSPDTEDNVGEETDAVFRNFVYHLYQMDRNSPDSDPDSPRLHELTAFPDTPTSITEYVAPVVLRRLSTTGLDYPGNDVIGKHIPGFSYTSVEVFLPVTSCSYYPTDPCSSSCYSYNVLLRPASRVGRQLAQIGDEIHARYTPEFNQMIRMLNLTPETAYEAFAGVARKLFRDGQVNWGRVITLLCFGYRMAVTVIERGMRGFFSQIVGFVVRFICSERIARWIAEQGGWRAALRYIPETVGWSTLGVIAGVAAVSILAAFFLSRKNT